LGKQGGIVAEGRDMGTVVFPDTRAKFFLDAEPKERARRRWRQLKDMGVDEEPLTVRSEMEKRDRDDATRIHSPLKKADDAIHLDTTGMTIDEVVKTIAGKVMELEGSGA
jgi:cytidylate kinase